MVVMVREHRCHFFLFGNVDMQEKHIFSCISEIYSLFLQRKAA